MLLAVAAVLVKTTARGLLALALVRPWARVIPRRRLQAVAAAASVLLIGYGGLNVLAVTLVLAGVLHAGGGVDRTALRWHAGLWDWGWLPSAIGAGR